MRSYSTSSRTRVFLGSFGIGLVLMALLLFGDYACAGTSGTIRKFPYVFPAVLLSIAIAMALLQLLRAGLSGIDFEENRLILHRRGGESVTIPFADIESAREHSFKGDERIELFLKDGGRINVRDAGFSGETWEIVKHQLLKYSGSAGPDADH